MSQEKIINQCKKYNYEYLEWLKDKKVIIVGPSNLLIGKSLGAKIDSYDIVVRLNNSFPLYSHLKKDLGSRTDVIYHTSGRIIKYLIYTGKQINKTPRQILKSDSVKFMFFRQGWNSGRANLRKYFWKFTDMDLGIKYSPIKKCAIGLKRKLKSPPNMGILAITHILNSECKSLTVIGCDFYKGKYYKGYAKLPDYYFDFKERRLKKKDGTWAEKKTRHSVRRQLYYLHELTINDKRLKLNKELRKLIKNRKNEKR